MSFDWKKLAEGKKQLMLDMLAPLVAINTIRDEETADVSAKAPYGKSCRQALDLFLTQASERGFETADINGYACRAEFGTGDEILGIITHMDIVPAGEGWLTDPFKLTIKDGMIFGRGVIDNKGPVVAVFAAMEIVRELVKEPKRKIHLIVGCSEETGMDDMDYYVKNVKDLPTVGLTPDSMFPVVFAEKAIMRVMIEGACCDVIKEMSAGTRVNVVPNLASAVIDIGKIDKNSFTEKFKRYLTEKNLTGTMNYREDNLAEIIVNGISCHAQEPWMGVNAISHLLSFVGEATEDSFARQLGELCGNWDGSGFGIKFYSEQMKDLSMNLGVISISAGKFQASIDMRFPNELTFDDLEQKLKDKLAEKKVDWSVKVLSKTPALYYDPNSPFVKSLTNAYREITLDHKTPPQITGGGTYARKFDNHVAFGPLFLSDKPLPDGVGTLHQANEAMEIDQLITFTAIYAKVIHDYLV